MPTEAAAETPTAPVTTKATPTTTEAVTETTTTKPAAEPTTAKPTTTTAPATTAARKEATPHTGEVSFVLPAALTLLLACAVLSLLKKREVRHAA